MAFLPPPPPMMDTQEHEQHVLGTCFHDPQTVLTCLQHGLQAHEMGSDAHRYIFQAIQASFAETQTTSCLQVQTILTQQNLLTRISGKNQAGILKEAAYLYFLEDEMAGSPVLLPHYIQTIKAAAVRRYLLRVNQDEAQLLADPTKTVAEIQAVKIASIVESQSRQTSTVAWIKDVMPELEQEIAHAGTEEKMVRGIPFGIPELDLLTTGMYPGDLYIIAARPSHGKTALMVQTADALARQGIAVYIFSQDITKKKFFYRFLSQRTGIPGNTLRVGQWIENQRGRILYRKFNPIEKEAIHEAATQLATLNICISDDRPLTVQQFQARMMLHVQRFGTQSIAIVDYTQLVKNMQVENPFLEVGEVAAMMKDVGGNLAIPVIAGAQIKNRDVKDETNPPNLSMVSMSGRIEQETTVGLLPFRPNRKKAVRDNSGVRMINGRIMEESELMIGKSQEGEAGVSLPMLFDRWSNVLTVDPARMEGVLHLTAEPPEPEEEENPLRA